MSRRFFKATSMIVAGIMVMSVLAGCGKSNKDTQNAGKTADAKGPVTLEWLAYAPIAQPDPNSEIVKKVEEKFNVKFNFWAVDDQKWDDVLNVKFAAGEMPDVMRIKNLNNIDKYVSMGILAELPESKLKELAPTYVKIVEKYDTNNMIKNAPKYNGKNYGFTMIAPDQTYPTILEWRTDWLKNIGIDKVPETLQEYETALYKFRNGDPDKNGQKDTYGMSTTAIANVFGAFGINESGKSITGQQPISNMLKDGKIVFSAIQPEAKDALATLQKWYKDGVIDPEFITGENKGGYWALSHAFMNSKIGVTGEVSFYHYAPPSTAEGAKGGTCYQETQKVNPNAQIAPGKPVTGPNGKSGTQSLGGVGETFGITTNAMKDDRKVKAILSMLETEFTDEDYYKMVQWGQKDVNYKVDDKNNVMLTTTDAAELRKNGIMVFHFLSGSADFWKKNSPSRYEYAEKYAKGPSYVKPIVPSTEAYTKNSATLNKLVQQAYIDIITGAKPVDYFDQFVKDFRAKGGDETEKAMTDAYNKLLGK